MAPKKGRKQKCEQPINETLSSSNDDSSKTEPPEPASKKDKKSVETKKTNPDASQGMAVFSRMSIKGKTDNSTHSIKKKFTDFDGSATTFAEVVGKGIYVDKSLFIKDILNHDWRYHLITAPRRFGKSTILNMLKHFVEINVDKDGKTKWKTNLKLFKRKLFNGSSLKIMDEDDIVKKHFAQYPVIYVDFKCDGVINSYDAAVKTCKRIVRKAYLTHKYLANSLHLEAHEKKLCRKWIDDEGVEDYDITDGLKNLAEFLYTHHKGKSVFLLVDEYDSVIMNALFKVGGNTLRWIAEFCIGIFSAVLKTSDEPNLFKEEANEDASEEESEEEFEDDSRVRGRYVARAIITGISHIAGVGISGMNNVASDPFLRRSEFLDYYGLTESEVKDLLSRVGDNKITLGNLKEYYNGYTNQDGIVIYPLWSVLNCLDKQELGQYYEGTGTIEKLAKAFQTPTIRSNVQQLVSGLNVHIRFKDRISTDDLVHLHNQLSQPELRESPDANIFFRFLFEQGYLTYGEKKENPEQDGFEVVDIKIPNEELKKTFCQELATYYTTFCKLDENKRRSCRNSFVKLIELANSNDANFKTGVECLHKDLEDLLRSALSEETCLRLNEAALHTSVCFVFFESGFRYTTEYILQNGKRLDLAVVKDECGFILEFKYDNGQSRDTTAVHALLQVKTNEYDTVFDERTIFQSRPGKIISMGISINNSKELSIACEISGEQMETIYIPDEEKAGISRKRSKTKRGLRAKTMK